jgi:hypothetical protein
MSAATANTPKPAPAPSTGSRCLRCGAPVRDVMGNPPYFLRLCQCARIGRPDFADGAAMLFCVVAIAAWGCL